MDDLTCDHKYHDDPSEPNLYGTCKFCGHLISGEEEAQSVWREINEQGLGRWYVPRE